MRGCQPMPARLEFGRTNNPSNFAQYNGLMPGGLAPASACGCGDPNGKGMRSGAIVGDAVK